MKGKKEQTGLQHLPLVELPLLRSAKSCWYCSRLKLSVINCVLFADVSISLSSCEICIWTKAKQMETFINWGGVLLQWLHVVSFLFVWSILPNRFQRIRHHESFWGNQLFIIFFLDIEWNLPMTGIYYMIKVWPR